MQQMHILGKRVKSNRSNINWGCIVEKLCVQVEKEHIKIIFLAWYTLVE